jgi:hypothetical protein
MTDKWAFADPQNVAVITLRQIVDRAAPILFVTHDEEDGAWQFLDGQNVTVEDSVIVSLKHMTMLDPGISELADLPYGWQAHRQAQGEPWIRTKKGTK